MSNHILWMVSLALLFASSCTKLKIDAETGEGDLEVTLPSLSQLSGVSSLSSMQSLSSAKMSSTSFKSSILSSGFSQTQPGSLSEIVCFAIAVDLPNSSGKKCSRGDGHNFAPGLMQGLYKAGETVTVKVPAGSDRKIFLLGFAGTSSDACVNLKEKYMPKVDLSLPVIIGEVTAEILSGGKTTLTITPDLANAVELNSCDDEIFQPEPPADSTPPPTIPADSTPPPDPNAAPKTNLQSCATPAVTNGAAGDFACYGLWDFSNSFGEDANMCGSGGAGYSSPITGCEVDTTACASGKAVAAKVFNIYKPWDSATDGVSLPNSSELTQIATRLGASESVVSSNIIRIWEYQCSAPPSEPPPPPRAKCPAETMSLTFDYYGQTYTCSGPMPESNAGTNAVWGYSPVAPNMTKEINGFPMNGYSTGPSCISTDFGVHYHTLSSTSTGTCLNYCTLIADCGSDGYWKNKRYTW